VVVAAAVAAAAAAVMQNYNEVKKRLLFQQTGEFKTYYKM
jgi:hypothetical protein